MSTADPQKRKSSMAQLYGQIHSAFVDKTQTRRFSASATTTITREPSWAICDTHYDTDSSTTSTVLNSPVTPHHSLIQCNEPLKPPSNPFVYNITAVQQQINNCHNQQAQCDQEIKRLKYQSHSRQEALENCVAGIVSLKNDLKVFNLKCLEEMSQIETIQRSKERAKRELEELGQRLFEEANHMVRLERREKERIQATNDHHASELKRTQTRLGATQKELEALRRNMEAKDTTSDGPLDTFTRTRIDLARLHGEPLRVQWVPPNEDNGMLAEFHEFALALPNVSLRKLHSLKFMKHCLGDDIEPCLRMGPSPLVTSRKIIDAVVVKTCFVEACPKGFARGQAERHLQEEAVAATASLWERFAFSPHVSGCQACGRSSQQPEELSYRFRVSYFDDWACIDRYCRDRLASVISFYDFIRRLRTGVYQHRSLWDIYQECVCLRLQMFLSRMGALPVVLEASGLNSSIIGKASTGIATESGLSRNTVSSIDRLSSTESIITLSTLLSLT
ncbi:hypothetical protein CLU79DRAFT_835530 [Phycomyces nitens]|nr:hypothetical protein CLU79DRAFT_835530 [Phycomyces nitens]